MTGAFRNARQAIQSEAAEWVLRLDEAALTLSARTELLRWLKQSPQHIEEFLFATAAWRDLDDIDPQKRLDVNTLIAEAESNVVALGDRAIDTEVDGTATRRRAWWIGGIAAAALLTVGAVLTSSLLSPTHHYETGVGQQTLFTLADGSIVHLNTQSELTVHMTKDSRNLELVQGEAMFEVAKDSSRPFRVSSGDVSIEAIGTQFNVYRRKDGVHVTVVEGAVKVETTAPAAKPEPVAAAITLTTGEEARSNRSGDVARIETPDVEKHTAWREQRLVFRGDSLATVATEFNRYNQLQIVIVAPPSATRPITATFDAHDPESFITFLERDPTLRVARTSERIEIRSAN